MYLHPFRSFTRRHAGSTVIHSSVAQSLFTPSIQPNLGISLLTFLLFDDILHVIQSCSYLSRWNYKYSRVEIFQPLFYIFIVSFGLFSP